MSNKWGSLHNYSSIDGALYSKDGKILVFVPTAMKSPCFKIPNCVISIVNRAFMTCNNVEVIKIPANAKEIGKMAFWSCSAKQIIFSDDSKIEVLPQQTFGYFDYLKYVKLPDHLKEICDDAFSNCRDPDLPTRLSICFVLGTTPDYILGQGKKFKPQLIEIDEVLAEFMAGIRKNTRLLCDGEPIDKATREKFALSLTTALEVAKKFVTKKI